MQCTTRGLGTSPHCHELAACKNIMTYVCVSRGMQCNNLVEQQLARRNFELYGIPCYILLQQMLPLCALVNKYLPVAVTWITFGIVICYRIAPSLIAPTVGLFRWVLALLRRYVGAQEDDDTVNVHHRVHFLPSAPVIVDVNEIDTSSDLVVTVEEQDNAQSLASIDAICWSNPVNHTANTNETTYLAKDTTVEKHCEPNRIIFEHAPQESVPTSKLSNVDPCFSVSENQSSPTTCTINTEEISSTRKILSPNDSIELEQSDFINAEHLPQIRKIGSTTMSNLSNVDPCVSVKVNHSGPTTCTIDTEEVLSTGKILSSIDSIECNELEQSNFINLPQTRRIGSTTTISSNEDTNIAQCDINCGMFQAESPVPIIEKIVLLIGATGAGKSTLVNGLANCLMCVNWEDSIRYKLVDEGRKSQVHSQTSRITTYTFQNSAKLKYVLTVIDTPGLGDTKGLERDQEIIMQIKSIFTKSRFQTLHAIGFVAQAPLVRLTTTQRYVFDSLLALFGNDVVDNILVMATFADWNQPPLLAAMKDANIPFCEVLKFNNCALYLANKSSDGDADSDDDGGEALSLHRLYWKMGVKSFDVLFNRLDKLQGKSMKLTSEVLKEKHFLENAFRVLLQQIKIGISKILQLQVEKDLLSNTTPDRETYEAIELLARDVKLASCKAVHCTKYNVSCYLENEGIIPFEEACDICPYHCAKETHHITSSYHEVDQTKVLKNVSELRMKYSGTNSIETIERSLHSLNAAVLTLLAKVQCSQRRLDQIALRPVPHSEVQYIEQLIQLEKQEARPGFEQNVRYYEEVMKQAHLLFAVKDVDIDDQVGISFIHKVVKNTV